MRGHDGNAPFFRLGLPTMPPRVVAKSWDNLMGPVKALEWRLRVMERNRSRGRAPRRAASGWPDTRWRVSPSDETQERPRRQILSTRFIIHRSLAELRAAS